MDIIEHYNPEEETEATEDICNILQACTLVISIIVFVLFCTMISDQEVYKKEPLHPEYILNPPCNDLTP